MQLPKPTAAPERWTEFGNYTARRLRRAREDETAQRIESATALVKESARIWRDAAEAAYVATADRDAADSDLDFTAQTARVSLAGRGVGADKEAPYTLIFHRGISYYTAAPLDEEIARYSELKERLEKNLAIDDGVRAAAVPAIEAGIQAFAAARETLAAARRRQALALTDLEAAEEALGVLLERTYGALVQTYGKKKAETFFPRKAPKRKAPA